MDLESNQNNVVAKLPLLKQENGNSFKLVPQTTANADGTSTLTIPGPVTTKEKAFDRSSSQEEYDCVFKKQGWLQDGLLQGGESLELETTKKQKMEQETEKLKKHLQIIPDDDDDDVYTDDTPLASKILIIDYKIHTERNRPFKIIRADGNHRLFLSFSIMLKKFDREDLESLCKIIRERFKKTKPKNYSDDYLLNTLKIMFEKPNVEANVWKDQTGKNGLAKVKSWKLIESCGVHWLTLSTTQIFLLVERMYPLTHFTLEQMVNDVRHEVEDESEMSLELLRLVRRQLNEGCTSIKCLNASPSVGESLSEET
nr:hypothetical protein [Tanacetum cinerariifolium]